ncbi:MAG: hypothetical protein ACOYM3_04965 [Terrimicrobiaceae bacterium]
MKKKIEYTDEPKDGMELPESGFKVVSRARQISAGLPSMDAAEYERAANGDRVTLTPVRGGRRQGAGRRPTGHVRMQLLVSPATRRKIESLAKHRKVTLSEVVEHMFA